MDDLTAFLSARLDEREALARKAYESYWRADLTEPRQHIITVGQSRIGDKVPVASGSDVVLPHIAANDPAYVLADVAAKREIVAMCEFLLETREVQEAAGELSDYSLGRAHAGGGVLRRLALPFAEHPDYREEWKP